MLKTFVAPTDMVDAINAYAKNTGQSEPESRGELYRAALEGLAPALPSLLGHVGIASGSQDRRIHIVGGGSLNELLCQMTADACNRTVVAGPVEATAIGNVLMQLVGLGQIRSSTKPANLCAKVSRRSRTRHRTLTHGDEPAEKFLGILLVNRRLNRFIGKPCSVNSRFLWGSSRENDCPSSFIGVRDSFVSNEVAC